MANAALRPEKDFTKEVDQQIPQAELLAKVCYLSNTPLGSQSILNFLSFCRPTSRVLSSSSPSSRSKLAK